jgi:hypothetical protein
VVLTCSREAKRGANLLITSNYPMHVLLLTLTDDPLDPPGEGRYGGAQLFMFDLGRHLVRRGNSVTFLTRKSRPDKPEFDQLGPQCQIFRLKAGPEREASHHDIWPYQESLRQQTAELMSNLGQFDSILSYNWISGLLAIETKIKPHVHHILSLGRVRKELGEEDHSADYSRDQGELKVFNTATRLICVCNDEIASLQRLYPEVDHSKAVVIPYPVNPDAYSRRPLNSSVFLRWKAKGLQEGT